MAEFRCDVAKIIVETHPDPEVLKLEVGRVGDYKVVIPKGVYQTGDVIAYIPEQAIVPEKILASMGLIGKLDGASKNRVKIRKLRGVYSQGLVYVDDTVKAMSVGSDATEYLGVLKYEPPIPVHLSGQVNSSGSVNFKFDIENIKKYPEVFVEGEEVVFTEKLHGTFNVCMLIPEADRKEDMADGKFFVSSKGQASKGLYLKDNEKNAGNSYIRVFKEHSLGEKILALKEYLEVPDTETLAIIGEILGVQSGFGYGNVGGKLGYRSFGIRVGRRYLNWDDFQDAVSYVGIDSVPILYRGPFSKEVLQEFTSGYETITGKSNHIREGVVVYPIQERFHDDIGRVILKSVSEEYLLKSSGEEFN